MLCRAGGAIGAVRVRIDFASEIVTRLHKLLKE
jgi:hypothetical protein